MQIRFRNISQTPWTARILSERQNQRVQINNTLSAPEITNAGCPQGSVLGPLLAFIYLDGLSKQTQNDILFFADDTSLYASYATTDLRTAEISFQRDLDSIYTYGRDWAITFNTSTTVQQSFSHKHDYQSPALNFGAEPVPQHKSHKHLGAIFSTDLRFHEHINEIFLKVNKSLSPLYPIAQYLPRPILDQVYKIYKTSFRLLWHYLRRTHYNTRQDETWDVTKQGGKADDRDTF